METTRMWTATIAITLALVAPGGLEAAGPTMAMPMLADQSSDALMLVQHRGGARVRAGGVARGPRGGVAAGRRVTTVRPGYRPGYRPGVRPGRPVVVAPGWRRPGNYWWRPGAAIAAGAAVGVIGAAAAASWAGSPPAPGYCWYYTDSSQRNGFWDVCPN